MVMRHLQEEAARWRVSTLQFNWLCELSKTLTCAGPHPQHEGLGPVIPKTLPIWTISLEF